MKRLVSIILSLILITTLCACGAVTLPEPAPGAPVYDDTPEPENIPPVAEAEPEPSEPEPNGDIVVLFTSDIHCGVWSNWTLAGVDAIRSSLRKSGTAVLLVDNGDAIQGEPLGTMTTGEAVIRLMNSMKYDVATIGNHEFDYGMDRFQELENMADFDYVSCNFNRKGELLLKPYVIKDVGGVKIAFLGISTPHTLIESTPKYFMDDSGEFIYGFCQDETGELLYSTVQESVDSARSEGADYVVALAHLGNELACSPYTYAEVLENTSGIDALLDGHSHDLEQVSMLNRSGETVLRSACGTKLQGVGWLKISSDGELSTGVYTWNNEENAAALLGLDSDIRSAYETATGALDAALSEVVAHSETELSINDRETGVRISRNQDTSIGELCADAFRIVSGADIGIVNGGGLRASLPEGNITRSDILRVHPFGNMLCVCEATGQEILDALEMAVRVWPDENGGWLIPSGLSFEVHTYIESSVATDSTGMFIGVTGEYRVKNVIVGGEPLELEKTYTIASINHLLQDMGDGYTMFADNNYLQDNVMLDNQVLITYIEDSLNGVIDTEYAEPQGRIIFIDERP